MPHYPKPFFKKSRGLWYVEIDRRQINIGPDREKAFQRYYALMSEPQRQRIASGTLAGIGDAFLDWVKQNRSPDTFEWYRFRLQRFFELHPRLELRELRPFHVQRWIDGMDVASGTKRNYGRAVKRCVRWAKTQGYIDSNPIEDLELPAAGQRDQIVSESEWESIMAITPEGRFRDLLRVTWLTGCRPQESLRVEARHVDLAQQRWVFPKSEAKGKRAPRIVYLTGEAVAITKRLMVEFPSGKLFRNANGDPWTKDAVNCAFTRLQIRMGKEAIRQNGEGVSDADIIRLTESLSPTKKVGEQRIEKSTTELRAEAKRKLINKRASELAPKYSLYALRHSWANRALKSGVDALTVAILMGHSDPSTLAKVYQHLSHDPEHLLHQAKRAVE